MRSQTRKSCRSAVLALILGGFLGLAFIGVAKAHTKDEVRRMVLEEARKSAVPVALAVARIESNFNDNALSPKGARGVMQIMPATAKAEFGTKPADPAGVAGTARRSRPPRSSLALVERPLVPGRHHGFGPHRRFLLPH